MRCANCSFRCSSCGLPPERPLHALGLLLCAASVAVMVAGFWWLALKLFGAPL